MKSIRPALIFSLFTLLTTFAAAAQTTPAQPARTTAPAKPAATTPATTAATGSRIGLIDAGAFDSKEGLTRYAAAQDQVDSLFKKEIEDLKALGDRIVGMEADLRKMQQQLQAPADPKVPVNNDQLSATFRTKNEEYERLGREYKFKQEDIKIRYQNKTNELVAPVMKEISEALQEYAKAKGFVLIFDTSKMVENEYLLAVGDVSVDVTKDFIQFFNARPPKTVAPK